MYLPAARHERREAQKADKDVRTPTGGSEKVRSASGRKADQRIHTPTGGSARQHIQYLGVACMEQFWKPE